MTVDNGWAVDSCSVPATVAGPAGLSARLRSHLAIVIAGLDPAIEGCTDRTQFWTGGVRLTHACGEGGLVARELRAVITFLDPRVKPWDDRGQWPGGWLLHCPRQCVAPPDSASHGERPYGSSLQGLTL